MRTIIFAFIIALLAVNFPMAVSLIATNAKFNKKGVLKNGYGGYGYFVGIGTIVTTVVTVIVLIFVAKICF